MSSSETAAAAGGAARVRVRLGAFDRWLVTGAGAIITASIMPLAARLGWAFELTTHFRLQYLVAALVLLGVLAVRRRFAWCAALVAGGVLNAIPLAPYLPQLPTAAVADGLLDPTVIVMAANVWRRNTQHWRLIELVNEVSPDVLLLVEYDSTWATALEPLRESYPHRHSAPRDDDFGIALYSRHPLRDVETRDLRGTSAIDARVLGPAGTVRIVGVHLTAPTSPRRAARRNRQLEQLAAFTADIDEPLVVMGDFNVTPFSPYFRDWISETGLRDAAAGRGPAITWPALFPALGIPIDHCMLSPQLRVTGYRRLPAFGSDHYAVLVGFLMEETS